MDLNFSLRFGLSVISLLIILESCSVQDHLQPAANPYKNCLLKEVFDVDFTKIDADSKLKIGDPLYSWDPDFSKVVDVIVIDGQKYALGSTTNVYHRYKYDSKKRLVEHFYGLRGAKGADVWSFDYSFPNKLTQKYDHLGFPDQTRTITYDLDENGIIMGEPYIYTEYDWFVHRKNNNSSTGIIISDGNLVKIESEGGVFGKFTIDHEYFLTKANFPNPFPFFGEVDRNLRQRTTGNYEGYKYITEYRYMFDKEGKVVRKIAIKSADDYKNILITGYEYECR
ncbi:hypothetical protein [Larkinella sp. C7]|jgi:hypothetical protein|uniref:hypothetical protein n=1 Tax=Larkinella sp. C7 TaxID=2576607 RepID=UPI0011113F64|nr:hypothetical protein [Larkinella sp. C7]